MSEQSKQYEMKCHHSSQNNYYSQKKSQIKLVLTVNTAVSVKKVKISRTDRKVRTAKIVLTDIKVKISSQSEMSKSPNLSEESVTLFRKDRKVTTV